jgi:DNA-binding NarL/FixJ family response regulator
MGNPVGFRRHRRPPSSYNVHHIAAAYRVDLPVKVYWSTSLRWKVARGKADWGLVLCWRQRIVAAAMNQMDRPSAYDVLSRREREVMLLATRGLSNKEIARELNVREGTIKLHLHRVYHKLGVRSRFALAALVQKEVSH